MLKVWQPAQHWFFAAVSETVIRTQAEKYYPRFWYSPDVYWWSRWPRFSAVGIRCLLGDGHQVFGDGDSNEVVGGGEGGAKPRAPMPDLAEWGPRDGAGRRAATWHQGSSLVRDAARNGGCLGGRRWTLNEQEQTRSNFCAFRRPLRRSKTRRDRSCHLLLVRVWILIKAVYRLISFSIMTCRSILIIRCAVVILLKTKYGHSAADKLKL